MLARRRGTGLINQLARYQQLVIEAKLNAVLKKYKIECYMTRVLISARGVVVIILTNTNMQKEMLDMVGYSWTMEMNIVL